MARVVTAIVMGVVAGDWTATGWPAAMEGAVRSAHGRGIRGPVESPALRTERIRWV
jgi:hypothetical protein